MLKFTNRTIAILSITVLTMIAWIGFEIFHVQQKKVVRPLAKQAESMSTELKLDVLEELQNRPTFTNYRETRHAPAEPVSPPPATSPASLPPLPPSPPPSTPSGFPVTSPTP